MPWMLVLVAWTGGAAVLVRPTLGAEGPGAERRVIQANVLDGDGRPVPGLTAPSFRGEFRGRPVTVLSATEDDAPRRVALVVDVSGSQAGKAGESSWRAAEQLVDLLTPRHRVVVLTVRDTVRKHSELTNDRQVLQKAMRDARARSPWGPSSLYDGVLQVSLGFRGMDPGNVVCLFSDGEDTSSALDRGGLEKALATTGVRVFVVRPEPDRPPVASPLLFREAERWMKEVTEATGGTVVRLRRSGQDGEGGLPDLLSSIANVYRLEVVFPSAIDKPRAWKLELSEPEGARLRNARLVYPRTVAPAATGP